MPSATAKLVQSAVMSSEPEAAHKVLPEVPWPMMAARIMRGVIVW